MELDEGWEIKFKDRLDKSYAWPSLYAFKFIVKAGQEAEVQKLFPPFCQRQIHKPYFSNDDAIVRGRHLRIQTCGYR